VETVEKPLTNLVSLYTVSTYETTRYFAKARRDLLTASAVKK